MWEREIRREKRNERFSRRRAEAGAEVSYWLYCLPARRLLGAGACTACYRSIKCWPRRLLFARRRRNHTLCSQKQKERGTHPTQSRESGWIAATFIFLFFSLKLGGERIREERRVRETFPSYYCLEINPSALSHTTILHSYSTPLSLSTALFLSPRCVLLLSSSVHY